MIYRCGICEQQFDSCNTFGQHKRTSGHHAMSCLDCGEFIISKSAFKRHRKLLGHQHFDGVYIPSKNNRLQDLCLTEESPEGGEEAWEEGAEEEGDASVDNDVCDVFEASDDDQQEEDVDGEEADDEEDDEVATEAAEAVSSDGDETEESDNTEEDWSLSDVWYGTGEVCWFPGPVSRTQLDYSSWMGVGPDVEDEVEESVEEVEVAVVEAKPKTVKKPKNTQPRMSARQRNKENKRAKKGKGKKGKAKEEEQESALKSQGRVLDFHLETKSNDFSSNQNFADQAEQTKQALVALMEADEQVGVPEDDWLWDKMEAEWSSGPEAIACWEYITGRVPQFSVDREIVPGDGRDEGHEALTLKDFGKLKAAQLANLSMAELAALRLYTGPGYTAINNMCRTGSSAFVCTAYCIETAIIRLAMNSCASFSTIKISGVDPATDPASIEALAAPYGRIDQVHMPVNKTSRLGRGVFFVRFNTRAAGAACVKPTGEGGLNGHCFQGTPLTVDWAPTDSAKMDTFRGLKGAMPAKFVSAYAKGAKMEEGGAIADPAFMSTTRNKETALEGQYGGNNIFVMRGKSSLPGLLRGGADVSWISQFPKEEEVLFPRFTELWYCSPLKRCITREIAPITTKKIFEFSIQYNFNKRFNIPHLPSMRCKALRGERGRPSHK